MSVVDEQQLRAASLQQIIALIYTDWGDTIDSYAAQYLNALDVNDCEALDDPVGNETAEIQVRYFLSNASGWKGATARAVKAVELGGRMSRSPWNFSGGFLSGLSQTAEVATSGAGMSMMVWRAMSRSTATASAGSFG